LAHGRVLGRSEAQNAVGKISGVRALKKWPLRGLIRQALEALFFPILSLKVLVFISENGYAFSVTV
jgi:hypothetical protein